MHEYTVQSGARASTILLDLCDALERGMNGFLVASLYAAVHVEIADNEAVHAAMTDPKLYVDLSLSHKSEIGFFKKYAKI